MGPERFHAFLSHNSKDAREAQALAVRLEELGVRVWLDTHQLTGGTRWLDSLEEAFAKCNSCIVLVGPSGIGEWQEREVHLAVDRSVHEEFKVIPVLLPGVKGSTREALPGFLGQHQAFRFETAVDEPAILAQLRECILGPAPPPVSTDCPYRGLRYFDVDDARYFYGRQELTNQLVEQVQTLASASGRLRFLAIVGCSGSGKSSLARAGLIAAIKEGQRWPFEIFRPGTDPIQSLALAAGNFRTGERTVAQALEMMEALRKNDTALDIALRIAPGQGPCLILVDQFEECFTLCKDEAARRSFIGNLMQAARSEGGPAVVVICLRADDYGECLRFPELAAGLTQQAPVGPMSAKELLEAIELPAFSAGVQLETGLSDLIRVEVENEPGSLPLLQYTLEELWKRREGHRMTVAAFRALGQVGGVLETRANDVYQGFTPEQKQVCRTVFLRLVQHSEGGRYIRRRARISELFSKKSGEGAVRPVVSALAGDDARLVIIDRDASGDDEDVVELAHEALIRSWSLLRQWLDEDKEFALWRKRLAVGLGDWERSKFDASALLRGRFLDEATRWCGSRADDLNAKELAYIDASTRLRTGEKRRRRIAFAASAVLIVGALLIIQSAYRQSASRRLAGEARRTLDAGNPALPVSLALHALDRAETREAREALAEAVQSARGAAIEGHTGRISAVAFSPNSEYLLTASEDESARLWDARYDEARVYGHGAGVNTAAFSPDGKLLATGAIDGSIRLWRLDGGEPVHVMGPLPNVITKVAFDATGRKLISACRDGTARIWDAETYVSEELLRQPAPVTAVAASSDGKLFATGDVDGFVRVWDAATRKEVLQFERHQQAVNELAFGDGGRLLASASDDGTAQIWDVRANRRLFTLARGAERHAVRGLAFSPAGEYLVTAELSGNAYLWSAASGADLLTLRRPGARTQLTSAAFARAPHGAGHLHAAIAAADGTVRVYEIEIDSLVAEAHAIVAGQEFAPEECREYFGSSRCSPIPRRFSIFRFWD
jgi:WD40 repeat protein